MPRLASSVGRTSFEVPREGASPSKRTNYIGGTEPSEPQAFMVHEVRLPAYIKPHFHHVRQFQVIVSKGARIGKREAPSISFHYADPSTPYGPIVPGEEEPLAFFTLRPELSDGTFYMPGSKEKMGGKAGRNIARHVEPRPADNQLETLIERQDDGLAAYRVHIAPGASLVAPVDPEAGGQYYLVMDGTLEQEEELPKMSLMFVAADEQDVSIKAGDEGADVLIMQFPTRAEH